MLKLALVLTALLSVNSHPLQNNEQSTTIDTTTINVVQLQKDINVVSYIQNFKTLMADYVNSQYKNLTINEVENIKVILEEFLTTFARDLKEVVEKQHNNVTIVENEEEKIEDGIPDSTFDEIKNRVRTEFPDIKEVTAKEIVHRLRKNLYLTRHKIDHVIRDSERAQIQYSIQ